jgi:hypothetical protein
MPIAMIPVRRSALGASALGAPPAIAAAVAQGFSPAVMLEIEKVLSVLQRQNKTGGPLSPPVQSELSS